MPVNLGKLLDSSKYSDETAHAAAGASDDRSQTLRICDARASLQLKMTN